MPILSWICLLSGSLDCELSHLRELEKKMKVTPLHSTLPCAPRFVYSLSALPRNAPQLRTKSKMGEPQLTSMLISMSLLLLLPFKLFWGLTASTKKLKYVH